MAKVQTSGSEEVLDEQKAPTEESEETETEGGETQPEEIDYKVKFSESSKEAQRLAGEAKRLEAERAATEERVRQLEAEKTRLEEEQRKAFEALKESNPEAYNFTKLEREVNELKQSVFSGTLEGQIEKFIQTEPLAQASRDAILRILKSNPSRTPQQVWEEDFRPVVNHAIDSAAKRKTRTASEQPESGEGSIIEEPLEETGLPANFSKLPLEKRGEILRKKGFIA